MVLIQIPGSVSGRYQQILVGLDIEGKIKLIHSDPIIKGKDWNGIWKFS